MAETPARIHPVKRQGAGEATPAAPDKVVWGTGEATTWNAFTSASGRFHVGHWSGEPGIRRVHYTEDEFCLILEGRVRLDAPDGTAEFGPGDAFVVEAGFLGTWETVERVTKLYAVAEPEPTPIP
jgi:uncharacterized protein